MGAVRLTWQAVTLALGSMAAGVATIKVIADRNTESDHILVMSYAIDHGGRMDANGDIIMPGDAEEGTFPGSEA